MKHYCVISHTHWDREWYRTQEHFRLCLIDLIDHLLEILDNEPDYIFHMDAQTIVFEDYWEIKPEMKEKCCKYIKEGRLLVGPWYVQNDFFLTSGEATVRNLLLGMKQADEMGHCSMTGYMPDQFGLISQLPQILNGFGIDHCVFGRGYDGWYIDEEGGMQKEKRPAEFLWKSPDGSEVLAICMSYWYNNAQRFSADIQKALKLTQKISESFEGVATTPYLLLMNGVDHLEAQEDLLPILEEVQKLLPDDEKIYQTNLEQYAEKVRNYLAKEDMLVKIGELKEGAQWNLLKDVTSSRIYLKVANSDLQNMLENRLEPLYAMLEMYGMKGVYPAGQLDYLWKMLIRNHAHDSICGCSNDAVHRHMEDRFAAIREVGKELQKRGMATLAAHASGNFEKDDYAIVVFNALEQTRTEVVDVTVDILTADCPKGICITDAKGEVVPFEILAHSTINKSVFSPINLPGNLDTERYEIRMLAKNIPALGYEVYRVQTGTEAVVQNCNEVTLGENAESYCIENENLRVTIHHSGKVDLLHKESNYCYEDFLTIQDTADVGNVYMSYAMPGDEPIDIADLTPCIAIEEVTQFVSRICLHYELPLPEDCDTSIQKRSKQMVINTIDIYLELKAESKSLDIRYRVDNHAKNHRMRALIRTGINSDITIASTPFDVVTKNKWSVDTRICNETEQNSGMVTICKDGQGVSVLNRGIYGYENLQAEEGVLAFTILRATSEIAGGVESGDGAWSAPENQSIRMEECEMSILPQVGDVLTEKALFAAKAYQNPLMAQCEAVDTHKFTGGRAAVQDTGIAELFFRKMPYEDVCMKRIGQSISVKGDDLQVTAFKKSFDRSGYILRFYNAKEYKVDAIIDFCDLSIERIWKTNMRETEREELCLTNNQVKLNVKGKEIVTLYMEI